jgi:sarcosine oxidase gamma subunit
MAEDWRLTASLVEGSGPELAATLEDLNLEEAVRARLGQRIAVSAGPDHVFLYADTRQAAEQAEALVSQLLEREGKAASFVLERWHPLEEEWEASGVPLPESVEERERERARLEAKDSADSLATGYAEWEVRLDLPSHRHAVELGDRLESEGFRVTRRWRYLLVGAASRDEAQALAERLRDEVPAGALLQVQAGGEMTWEVAPGRPFPLFVLPS